MKQTALWWEILTLYTPLHFLKDDNDIMVKAFLKRNDFDNVYRNYYNILIMTKTDVLQYIWSGPVTDGWGPRNNERLGAP